MASNESSRDVDIDLARLAMAVWERKTRLAIIAALAGAAAIVGSSMIAPKYKSEARLLIEARSTSLNTQDGNARGEEPVLDELNIASQSQVLQSVDLIKRVADELKLYELEEFNSTNKPGLLSKFLGGGDSVTEGAEIAPAERVLKAFREKMMVYQVERSRVIGVEFTSEDPKLAALIPNTILKTYMAMQSGAKLDTSSEAAKWLEPEIEQLRTKVREADQKVADFRKTADLLSVGEGSTFAARQLSDISTELARVKAEKAAADARAENVRRALAAGQPIDNFTDVVGSAMIQRLKESESQIQGQISDLSTSLMDGHPRLRSLRAQLAGIRQQINSEAQKIVSALESEASVASIREKQLEEQLSEIKANSARAGEQEVQLNELVREAAAQRQLLETYLARYREATTKAGSQETAPADARIISTAIEPQEAFFPKKGANTIVAVLSALIFSAIIIMLIELFSGRALRPVGAPARREVDDEVGSSATVAEQPLVTPTVPETKLRSTPAQVIASEAPLASSLQSVPARPAASDQPLDAFEQLTADTDTETPSETKISYDDFSVPAIADFLSMRGAKPVVVVVSPSGYQGSSLTVELARQLAASGRPTILVDMSADGTPSKLMTDEPEMTGIMDLLVGNAAFGDAIHGDIASTAHIVPRGVSKPKGPIKVYEQLAMVIGALSDAYETVLIECGAAKVDSIKRILNELTAEVILSVPDGNPQQIDSLIEIFKAAGQEDIMPMTNSMAVERV